MEDVDKTGKIQPIRVAVSSYEGCAESINIWV